MGADELVALSFSASWEDRIRAAEGLAALGPEAGHDDRLRALLNDPDNTAPPEAAAVALLKREDQWGVDLVLEMLGSNPDDNYVDKLLFLVGRHFTWENAGGIGPLVQHRLNSSDDALRIGAEELLSDLPWPPLPG
ncbi:hypothetical protein OJ997_18270 [Solirubrobacter phytolaccae]|uniref:HEAT repeat domain-containing protein n=1 Tax=Solirubrobacter phytolaccae TaxID=1404360 RepID=A0A9X3N9H6_9ACTN|nr:hypothetical protein [Solirubrobacter phytolaccae]MDA0182258.1 hypothetical protein [Solirubrobacter phytolaccae]